MAYVLPRGARGAAVHEPNRSMLIDVVNEQDEVVGQIRRDQALQAPIGFRTVHVFVFNSRGELLLQQLAPERDRFPARLGSSVAGYLFSGESYEQAAGRRIEQELGITDAQLSSCGVVSMRDEQALKFVGLLTTEHDGPFTPLRSQIAYLEFLALAEIDRLLAEQPERFTPTFRHVYRFYRTRQ